MSIILKITALFTLISVATSCRCGQEDEEETKTASGAPLPAAAAVGYFATQNSPVRLNPEQIAKKFKNQFGVEWGHTDQRDRFQNDIVSAYGLALGGIDFEIRSVRDNDTSVQTALVIRALSWRLANELIMAADDPTYTGNAVNLFSKASTRDDLPYEISDDEDQENRWTEQVKEIYWRIFFREPTNEELQVVRSTWLTIHSEESAYPPAAWVGVIYMLVSTMEFWTI